MRNRLASETEKERAARLQQMSANQHHRLASETEKERAARLQQMSANQHHRLAAETGSEREARLHQPHCTSRTAPAALHQPHCTCLRIHRIQAHARPHNAVHSPSLLTLALYFSFTGSS